MLKSRVVTTFNRPVSFGCVDNCGLCCSYKVHLLPSDVKRMGDCLSSQAGLGKEARLSKRDGFCAFLGKDNRCTVYDHRPSYCRTFPFYVEAGSEIDMDLSCPGIGCGDEVHEQFLDELYADAATRTDSGFHSETPSFYEELAASQPGYISHDDFKRMGLSWCDEMDEVNSLSELTGSATTLAKRQSPLPFDAPGLPEDFFDIIDGVNIHITSDNSLVRYTCEIRNSSFSINGRTCLRSDLESSSSDGSACADAAVLHVLREYLRIWFRRRIFYRVCLVSSLGAPMLCSPAGVAFGFMASLIGKVQWVAGMLQLYWTGREEAFDKADAVREAIRIFDGRLRTKCRAVGIQTLNQNRQ